MGLEMIGTNTFLPISLVSFSLLSLAVYKRLCNLFSPGVFAVSLHMKEFRFSETDSWEVGGLEVDCMGVAWSGGFNYDNGNSNCEVFLLFK